MPTRQDAHGQVFSTWSWAYLALGSYLLTTSLLFMCELYYSLLDMLGLHFYDVGSVDCVVETSSIAFSLIKK